MFNIDTWQEIFHTIRQNKLRTILTALGVIWGIFMLVIMLGAADGMERGVKQGLNGFASNSLYIGTRRTTMPYKGMKPGRRFRFNNQDIKLLKKTVKEIVSIAPRAFLRGEYKIIYGGKAEAFEVSGEVPAHLKVRFKNITHGRFINNLDIKAERKVAVIGRQVVKLLFDKDKEPIGEYIKIKGVYFRVVGVFKSLRNDEDAKEEEKNIFVPLTTLQKVNNFGEDIDWFICEVKQGASAGRVEKKIKAILSERHKVHPEDKSAYWSWNTQEEFDEINQIFIGMKGFGWFAGIFTMIAGIVGVSNIMLIVVKERTREIGVRKALGATPFSIVSMIMQESIFLTALSGYIGLVGGVGLISALNYFMTKFDISSEFFAAPQIDVIVIIVSLLILVITGALAGLIPAASAARIKPVEALKDE